MSDLLRYVVSIDPASKAIKVEQIGQAGELTEVDLPSFAQILGAGATGALQPAQIVVNIYAGGAPGGPLRVAASEALPETIYGVKPGPHPPPPPPKPPHKPDKPGKPDKK